MNAFFFLKAFNYQYSLLYVIFFFWVFSTYICTLFFMYFSYLLYFGVDGWVQIKKKYIYKREIYKKKYLLHFHLSLHLFHILKLKIYLPIFFQEIICCLIQLLAFCTFFFFFLFIFLNYFTCCHSSLFFFYCYHIAFCAIALELDNSHLTHTIYKHSLIAWHKFPNNIIHIYLSRIYLST